jgi:hypothetical protein
VRRYRDAPYADDNARSKRAKMARPKDLLAYFLPMFRQEMEVRMHSRGVWSDRLSGSEKRDGIEPVGGSHLGSPDQPAEVRAILEGEYFRTIIPEYEGHKEIGKVYATPLLAAIARVSGRGSPNDPGPFTGRVLWRTFCLDGDWDRACASLGIIEPARRLYIEAALHRLYERYHEEPPINYYHQQEGTAA